MNEQGNDSNIKNKLSYYYVIALIEFCENLKIHESLPFLKKIYDNDMISLREFGSYDDLKKTIISNDEKFHKSLEINTIEELAQWSCYRDEEEYRESIKNMISNLTSRIKHNPDLLKKTNSKQKKKLPPKSEPKPKPKQNAIPKFVEVSKKEKNSKEYQQKVYSHMESALKDLLVQKK